MIARSPFLRKATPQLQSVHHPSRLTRHDWTTTRRYFTSSKMATNPEKTLFYSLALASVAWLDSDFKRADLCYFSRSEVKPLLS